MKLYLLLLFMLAPLVFATSFIAECENQTWREEVADSVFQGSVISVDEKGFGDNRHTEIIFRVSKNIKGSEQELMILTQPGALKRGYQIPGITLEWNVGEQWRVEAVSNDQDLELVCGSMSRLRIDDLPEKPSGFCAQVITYAINPQTQMINEFPTPCDVPIGWEVVDAPIPVEPDGGIGDGAPTLKISLWNRFTNWLGKIF